MCVEPCLQPLTGEQFPASTNKSNEACLDIRARGFWRTCHGQQEAFFDVYVRVFYPFASSYRNSHLPTLYRQHELQKRLHYGLQVLEVERGCFTPLVFTTEGDMAPEATVCLKRLASMLSDKREESNSIVMGWLRCAISSPWCDPAWHASVGPPRAAKTQHRRFTMYARQPHRPNSRFHSILHKPDSLIYHSFCHSFLSVPLFLYALISLPSSALISFLSSALISLLYTLFFSLFYSQFDCCFRDYCALSIKLFLHS